MSRPDVQAVRQLLDIKLKPLPCPFCGEAPEVSVHFGYAAVTCETANCPASPISSGDAIDAPVDRAIERWNRRAPPPDAQREGE